ncbi:MAG: hypothetical protein LBP76_07045, partial [Treponema sp.]|nr:hypothetical protein [Treponema sp.]
TVAALVKSQATGYGGSNYSGTAAAKPAAAAPAGAVPALAGQTAVPAPAPAAPAPPPPVEKVYKIGDRGPAGGIVFYDMGFKMNGWRYLEAAPADIPGVWQWGAVGTKVRGTSNGIGNGKQNTKIILEILNQTGETMKAAQVADAYKYGGFDDWFFPSKDELDMMYKNLKTKGLGGFQSGSYWTSSVSETTSSYDTSYQNFSNGEKKDDEDRKNTSFYVRPIRQF